jgi:hypothetical protein
VGTDTENQDLLGNVVFEREGKGELPQDIIYFQEYNRKKG